MHLSEGGDEQHALGAGASAGLLSASAEEVGQCDALAHVERRNALRRAELMPDHGEEVDAELAHVERELTHRLRGVRVHQQPRRGAARRARRRRDLGHGHHRAHLVVGGHDGDEDRLRRDGGGDRLGRDAALVVDGHIAHREAAGGLEGLEALGDGRVLDVARDDVRQRRARVGSFAPPLLLGLEGAEDSVVVRLRAACREHDLLVGSADERGHCAACLGDAGCARPAKGMPARRVAPVEAQVRLGGRSDLRKHGRGGLIIEIDAVAVLRYARQWRADARGHALYRR